MHSVIVLIGGRARALPTPVCHLRLETLQLPMCSERTLQGMVAREGMPPDTRIFSR
jgi:hypothetical protein